MVENNTRKKLIIGAEIENQLCSKGAMLRNRGADVLCPFHSGTCTQTLPESESIGNECRSSRAAIRQVNQNLVVSHYTADGDSQSHKGVDLAQSDKHKAIHLRDVRHLAQSLKRQIYNSKFSTNMFKGSIKINLKNRFAMSVKARCVSELKAAHRMHDGDINKIKSIMPKIIDTLTLCFNGNCGSECTKYSFVCAGRNRTKLFLPENVNIRMLQSDQALLKACVNTFLGPVSLEMTKFLTSTQKVEAVNRALLVSNPKSVTFTRNLDARIHSQILMQNLGLADSAVLKCKSIGAELTAGSSVIKQAIGIERKLRNSKTLPKLEKAKLCRYKARQRRFQLHAEIHYAKGLCDPKPNLSGIGQLSLIDHHYAVPSTSKAN